MHGDVKTIIKRNFDNLKESTTYYGDGFDSTTEDLVSKLLKEGYTIHDQYNRTFDGFHETNYVMIRQNESNLSEVQILND